MKGFSLYCKALHHTAQSFSVNQLIFVKDQIYSNTNSKPHGTVIGKCLGAPNV